MDDVVEAVRQYYRGNKIAPLSFKCEHYAECRKGHPSFVKAREPFIGRRYGKDGLPRLLFISSNPPRGSRKPEDRTLTAARRWEETICDHSRLPKPLHWYRTHEMAHGIFKQFKQAAPEVIDCCRYFAHTNSAKCTTNAPNGREGPARLFRNCQQFLRGEIEALEPDVVITQGKMAGIALRDALGARGASIRGHKQNNTPLTVGCRHIVIGDRKILWIHSSHPRAYGPFNQERDNRWVRWARVALESAQER